MSTEQDKKPVYKSIQIRIEDFDRLRELAYKRRQKFIDLVASLLDIKE